MRMVDASAPSPRHVVKDVVVEEHELRLVLRASNLGLDGFQLALHVPVSHRHVPHVLRQLFSLLHLKLQLR